jgi:cytochrome c biogenesis protein CcmG, thiol:disulfide interchange protein DsbE
MRGKLVILAGFMVPLWAAQAEEVLPMLKANGQIYTNVTVTKITATDIYFANSSGMANAKLKDLDRKTQKHFHYNASKAKAAERQQVADAEQYHLHLVHDFPDPFFPQPSASQTNPPVSNEGKPIWARSYLNHQGPELFVERWLTPMPDTRNKFILYDFWATSSPACRAEIPELNAYQKEFSDRLVIIGASDENEETIRRITDPIVQYYLAIDTQARTKDKVGVTGLPHLMLMDPKGFVRWEGFPFLPGHEFSDKVLTDIIAQYDKETLNLEGTR